jgi:hypothetical protein
MKFDVNEFWRRYNFRPIGDWRLADNRELFRLAMRRSKAKVLQVWRKGQPRWQHKLRGGRHQNSVFVLDVRKTGFDDLTRQIQDAMRFLRTNQRILKSLRRFPGVDSAALDFGINRIHRVIQCETFPNELLHLAGGLGIDLEISIYPPTKPDRKRRRPNAKIGKETA